MLNPVTEHVKFSSELWEIIENYRDDGEASIIDVLGALEVAKYKLLKELN